MIWKFENVLAGLLMLITSQLGYMVWDIAEIFSTSDISAVSHFKICESNQKHIMLWFCDSLFKRIKTTFCWKDRSLTMKNSLFTTIWRKQNKPLLASRKSSLRLEGHCVLRDLSEKSDDEVEFPTETIKDIMLYTPLFSGKVLVEWVDSTIKMYSHSSGWSEVK